MTLQKNNNMKYKTPILIFDTNIFLTGIDFNLIDGIIYTTPNIIEEVEVEKYKSKNLNILNRIHAALENKKLVLKVPKRKYMQEVIEISKITGDFNALSFADKEFLALALEMINTRRESKITVFSNDYSIENVSSELNIPFSSLFKDGIKSKIYWEVYCPYCKNTYDVKDLYKKCETCGTNLMRRPKSNIIY